MLEGARVSHMSLTWKRNLQLMTCECVLGRCISQLQLPNKPHEHEHEPKAMLSASVVGTNLACLLAP